MRAWWQAALAGVLGLAAVACTRAPTAPELLRSAAEAIACSRYADALAALDGLQRAEGADRLDDCEVLRLRLVALSGLGRRDDALKVAGALARRCPSTLDPPLVARAGDLLIGSSGRAEDADALLAAAPTLSPADCERVSAFFAERARQQAWPMPALSEREIRLLKQFSMCDFGGPAAPASGRSAAGTATSDAPSTTATSFPGAVP